MNSIINECYIYCLNCNIQISLKEAVLEGWKICNFCQMIFCNECRKINESSDKCLGSPYVTPHKSVMRLLPIEHLIHFASSNIKGPKEGKYTTNIFFKHTEVKEKKPKNIQSEDFKIIRFREEQWKKYGTVLVKRKDGHFVTWGQID